MLKEIDLERRTMSEEEQRAINGKMVADYVQAKRATPPKIYTSRLAAVKSLALLGLPPQIILWYGCCCARGLKLTVSVRDLEGDWGEVMEEWLKKLVEQIKEQDHDVAERDAHEARKAKVIAEHGPQYWTKFGDCIKGFLDEAKELFGDDVTAGKISFTLGTPVPQITINKSAYPLIQFTAAPDFKGQIANINYSKANPKQAGQLTAKNIPARFELSHHHQNVFLQLDGKDFHEPKEAAKYIIEVLLSI
jgi:hypothetical protein